MEVRPPLADPASAAKTERYVASMTRPLNGLRVLGHAKPFKWIKVLASNCISRWHN